MGKDEKHRRAWDAGRLAKSAGLEVPVKVQRRYDAGCLVAKAWVHGYMGMLWHPNFLHTSDTWVKT
jgi:hypothetical protein